MYINTFSKILTKFKQFSTCEALRTLIMFGITVENYVSVDFKCYGWGGSILPVTINCYKFASKVTNLKCMPIRTPPLKLSPSFSLT